MNRSIEEKIEIVRQKILDGWSVHISLRAVPLKKHEIHQVKDALKSEIAEYNKRALNKKKKYYT